MDQLFDFDKIDKIAEKNAKKDYYNASSSKKSDKLSNGNVKDLNDYSFVCSEFDQDCVACSKA